MSNYTSPLRNERDNLEQKIDDTIDNVSRQVNRQVENLGNSIDNLVQNAVDSRNYTELNAKINNLVNQGVNQIEYTMNRLDPRSRNTGYSGTRSRRDLFVRSGGLQGAGIAVFAVGIILTIIFGIFTITYAALAAGGVFSGASIIALFFFLFFLAVGIAMDVCGFRRLKLVQRYKKYVSFLSDKNCTNIADLSYAVQIPEKTVRQDARRLIQKQWFREGHLDENEQILMLTNETWREYCSTLEQRRQNRRRAQEEQRRTEDFESKNRQVAAVLKEGERYLAQIRACNDAIPQKEITEKISRMEHLTEKIFARIREKPEQVDEIQKLMKYYLPTAIKLLNAYDELNRQSVQGENIVGSKREIEETLDTLNSAFEKLLDNLFEEIAWDVSSDISVLNTILAQEGLKDDGSGFHS